MGKEQDKSERQELVCPFCKLLAEICECFEQKAEFMKHFNNARIEFLEGIKSLIDARIESLRKRTTQKKVTKIEVT